MVGYLKISDSGLKRGFHSHIWKHLFGIITINSFLIALLIQESEIKDSYLKLINSFLEENISMDEWNKSFTDLLHSDPSGIAFTYSSFLEVFNQLLDYEKLIDDRKQAALYVDCDFDKETITYPGILFTRESVEERFQTYNMFINSTNELMEDLQSDDYFLKFKDLFDDAIKLKKFFERIINSLIS